jgi:protein O-mannosyl-transferase
VEKSNEEVTFKGLFVPLTTSKSICWIIFIGLAVFFNTLFNGFAWDDTVYIINNPGIRSLDIASLIGNNLFCSAGMYRPLSAIYFALFYNFFGENAFFYHLSSLLIHLTNVSLFFVLLKHFFSKKLSLFLSIIFLIHPIQIETASYIAGSGDLLFFLYGIIALLLSLKDNLSKKRLALISLLLFLSMLQKETGFLFLLTIIFYKVIFIRKGIIFVSISGFISALLYITIRLGIGNAETARSSLSQMHNLSLTERLLDIPVIIYYYLKTLVYPANLVIDQQWTIDKINFSTFYFPSLIVLLFFSTVFLIGLFTKKNKKLFLNFIFFVLIFLMGLSLHLQVIPLEMTVSDRWFYFPFVGLLGIIGVVCSSIKLPGRGIRILLYAVLLSIIVAFSIRTIVRNTDWSNNMTLYSHDTKAYDNNKLEVNLGYEYYLQGNFSKFLYHTNRSIKILPNELNISNLAAFYMNRGDMKKAREYYEKALTYNVYPQGGHKQLVAKIYLGLALSYINSKQFEQAKTHVETALAEYPAEGELWKALAVSEYGLHNKEKALTAAKKAKELLRNVETDYVYNQILDNKPIKLLF